jgi:hypothetical protein
MEYPAHWFHCVLVVWPFQGRTRIAVSYLGAESFPPQEEAARGAGRAKRGLGDEARDLIAMMLGKPKLNLGVADFLTFTR